MQSSTSLQYNVQDLFLNNPLRKSLRSEYSQPTQSSSQMFESQSQPAQVPQPNMGPKLCELQYTIEHKFENIQNIMDSFKRVNDELIQSNCALSARFDKFEETISAEKNSFVQNSSPAELPVPITPPESPTVAELRDKIDMLEQKMVKQAKKKNKKRISQKKKSKVEGLSTLFSQMNDNFCNCLNILTSKANNKPPPVNYVEPHHNYTQTNPEYNLDTSLNTTLNDSHIYTRDNKFMSHKKSDPVSMGTGFYFPPKTMTSSNNDSFIMSSNNAHNTSFCIGDMNEGNCHSYSMSVESSTMDERRSNCVMCKRREGNHKSGSGNRRLGLGSSKDESFSGRKNVKFNDDVINYLLS